MAEISIDSDREKQVTVISIKGILERDDLLNTLSEYFSHEPTLDTIYDSTEGDWSKIPTEQYLGTIRSAKSYARKGARVAMVFSSTLDFGIGRMLESFCENEEYENQHACFRSLEAAKKWLS